VKYVLLLHSFTLLNSVESRKYKVAELIAENVRIDAPKGWGVGEGCPLPTGKGLTQPLSRKILGILHMKCCNLVHIHS